jgi:FkbM family methyltransferase
MNKLIEIKKEFSSGAIDKWEFIDKMYEVHSGLFDYSDLLKNTNISKIEIDADQVIMTFRDSGIKFICTKNDKRIAPLDTLNFNNYEQEELNMQLSLIEPGFNVYDIGGNFGWFALHIAKNHLKSKIFSFEPIPSTFNFLNKNILLNKLENIECFNFGFSNAEGCFDFYFDPALSVNASLANVSNNKSIEKVSCSVKRLDDFVEETKYKIDFIKCDVEGAELLVFKGGIEAIKKHQPIVFSEILRKWTAKFDYHPNDLIKFFRDLNYNCYVLEGSKLRLFDIVDENTFETNYFFLHKEKHATQIKKFA